MQELVGKLSALDPEASEALKVVGYFDALIANRVGIAGLLRGAAVLADTVAGAQRNGTIERLDPAGRHVDGVSTRRSGQRSTANGAVWIERDGAPHANDEMILERLAFAVDLLESHDARSNGLAVAIDGARSIDERVSALARLRLEPHSRIRLIATNGVMARGEPLTVMPTRYGSLRAALDRTGSTEVEGAAGFGPWVRADHAPESWEGAVIALRLTTRLTPIVDAAELGTMLILARAYDPAVPHEDVLMLTRLDARSADILRVLVEQDSIRAAAAELAMHHSTLQAKHESLTRQLGYDPRSIVGRMRYIAAEMLRRINDGL